VLKFARIEVGLVSWYQKWEFPLLEPDIGPHRPLSTQPAGIHGKNCNVPARSNLNGLIILSPFEAKSTIPEEFVTNLSYL
jgi:hypothetical protein